jgi:WD40 repeat protein
MVGVRGYYSLSFSLLVVLLLISAAVAPAREVELYDHPVLVLEASMHTAPIRSTDVSAAGPYIVSGSDDKTVRVWDARTGQLLRTIRLPQGPGPVGKVYTVAISPDGALVAVGGSTGETGQPKSIYLFQRDTGAGTRRPTRS